MRILGIETSCDETSAAVVDHGCNVLSCVIGSSKKDFEFRGGVIPEDAARKQLEMILPVIEKALKNANCDHTEIDAIAVTAGPGLLGSLLVGTTTSRALSALWKKPLIPVHHTLGHLSSTWLEAEGVDVFPILTLSVSGGHSDLWYRTSHMTGALLGSTRDDAAGEAFDKGAMMLGLPYPGGPALASLADAGDEESCTFPLPLSHEHSMDFSFSGLKTSLKYVLRDLGDRVKDDSVRASIAASYQFAICLHLQSSVERALKKFPECKHIHVVGGVSANQRLRVMLKKLAEVHGIGVRWPSQLSYCTDNGAMIAAAGFFLISEKPETLGADFKTSATQSLSLSSN
ncbi:tRNA (adenosine(37)-N6)-threonylcarbamoyltransferase complex transferase subunit TsaD [Candidatus Peribacteria bacterium]|nr:tRNA (adenosine(37)-N6)-threonylcarbamoyltransferase complex transferase subunit TsaD [Candidatus Peribacteria bacterium]